MLRPLPFPFYFEELYSFIHQIEQFDQQFIFDLSSSQQQYLYDRKMHLLFNKIPSLLMSLNTQHGHDLLMPYILDAFRHNIYGVRCISTLFNPIAVVLGPDETRRQLLQIIQSVLNPDKTTNHHWRVFTRRFHIQLIARFGLSRFLHSFSILLVEACSGFKDDIIMTTIDEDSSGGTESEVGLSSDSEEIKFDRSDTIQPQDSDINLFEVRKYINRTIPWDIYHKIQKVSSNRLKI